MPIDWSKYGVIEEHPNERVPERIEPVPLQDVYALSSAQKRMYVLQQLDLTSTAYNMPRIFIIEGMLEHGRLEKAFSDLISRHESLRTRFFLKGGAPVQQVLQDVPFTVSFTNGTEGEAEHWAQSFIQPFDLHEAPLLRVKVMSLSDERHLLAIDLHHIIADGVTVNLLIRELLALYQEKELAPLPFQYKDFAVWQNARMKNEAYAKQEEYWLELLADELPVLELPLDKPHPAVQSFAGDSVETAADLKLKRKLELLARENGATLYMVLLAAYQTLLARYSGQDDIVVGSPIAGRPHADLEMVAGMFVNTLAMRGYPQIDKTFRIFLKEIRETVLEAFEHQEVQFEGIVEKLGIPRDVNRNPVFDTMFALQHKEEEPVQDSLTFRSYEVKHMAAKFDILLQAEEQSDGLRFIWEYRTALFERETVERFADHWLQLLRQITDDPDMRLGEIDLLSDSEKQQLLVTCNGTKADYPKDKTVHQLFEEQVKRTPDHIAAVFEDRKLTYQELNSRANQLARMLRRAGVKAEQPVALITERSLEMIVGIFAILKAGGAYVPIDPEYPEDRIRYMLEDSGTQMILASKAAQLPSTDSKTVFLIDDAAAAQYDSSNMEHAAAPEQLAYIMYTSGTTGRPKGVMVEHRNIVHLTTNRAYIPFAEIGRLAQTGAVSFDASVFEVFGTLLNGGTVYPVSKEILLDSTRMNLFLKNNGIMTMWLTSPLFNRHAQENSAMFAGLRHLIVGGDVLSVKHIHKVKRSYPELVLWNGYGPTENTTFSTCYQIQEESEIIPIGRPISHSSAYIVNSKGRLQPVGVPGELCLGGAGLARGYVNQPELTEEMFVSNPHAPGERMYKTGDVARWLPDGNIEYLGRFDQQVKVRGHRVELGEIESRLLEHECIQAAAVTVRDNGAGDKELCAYYVAMQAVKAEQLHHHVAAVLPSYMVPDFFTEIPSLPLTANGKLDRQALPEPDRATAADSYVEPATKTEAQLAGIWQEILGVERVGATDHFFKLGGHSLKAMSLISRIHQDMESDMRLREVFSHPTVRELASWIDRNGRTSRYARIEPAPQQEEYPVSSAQKRMYVLQQLDPKATAYNMPAFIMLEGELDYNRLEQAFRKLIQRHESLRTQFVLREGIPVQQVLTDVPFMMAYESETEKKARVWAQSFVQPFDLGKAPLLRAGVMPVSDKQNVLAIDMHHIIADGVTVNLLVNELCMMYEGADLEPLSIHYKDFAVWQNARIQSGDYATQEAYWREQLGGELPVLQLPADKPRPAMQSFAGDVVEATAGPELKRKLEQAAQESDTTLYIVLLAAYQTLLSRYSGQDDIIVGSPVAGRPHTDLEKIAGMFVNTLALRGNPAGNKTFRTFTKEMKETVLSAFENQDVQFEALVDMLGVRRDVNRNPVFDAMFALQNTDNPELTLDGLTLRPYEQQHTMAKFDVSLLAKENGDTLQFTWEYSTELFERETVERWTGHWLQLLGQITDNPDIRLGEIDVLTKAEKDQLLFSFNDTKAEYPRDKTIHQLFEEQTERTPRHTAVLYEGGQMTYQELNARANRLARILRNKGVKPDHIVGLMVRRSVEMLVGILGILKAGGAYLPIDPDYPEERIRFMLEDSQTRLLLRQPDGKAPISFNGKSIILDETEELSGIEPNLPPAAKANDLAYLIYTSGSTGKPKGVMVEHHSVINRLHWMQKCYPLRAHDVILQKTQFSFDVSVWELLWWGEVGAKVCLLPPGGEKDPKVLFQTIAQHGVTTIHFVPSMLSAFLDALEDENRVEQIRSVRRVFASGEALPAALVERFQRLVSRKIGADLINMYGPTEATVEVSHYKCSKTEAVTTVPIGKPIDNLQLSIVSPYQAMQPIGVAGELCISGAGLARGYLNRPELTAEKFVNHPFMTDVRMYKTGDLARWLPDGNIEYLGRADQQVKIRGYRVELGEIEHRLLEHKAVKEAVVTAQEDANGDKALSAYFVAKQPLAAEELRVHVASELPSYMVPAFFTSLPSMPLTANGKLNRKALPEPDRVSARPEYVKPATETEERLALLWQKVLGLKRAGAADHFFESGGHSLKAMTLVSRIHRELGADIHLRDIFRHPTVRELAKWIETNQNTSSHASIEPAPQQETYAVSSAQKRMYVLQQLDPHATAYNMPAVLVLEGDLDRKRLENAFQCLIERHESLRTRFILADGEPVQQVMKKAPLAVAYAGGTEEEAEQWAQSFVQPFDLRTAPLLRVGVMTISAVRHLLAIDMHHIIADGVTISNFINEFSRLYDGAVLDPLKIQYKDFAVWQNARMESEAYRKKEGYWIEQLGGELPLLQLPADKPRPPVQSFSGDVLTVTVEGEQKLKLERLARENGATLYMVLLAAYQTLLSHYTRQDDIIVGSPISGRLHADLENVAGMFANTLALRGYPKGEKTFKRFLKEIRETALEAFEHQEVPFEVLIEKLGVHRDINRNPIFDAMFALQNMENAELKMDGLTLCPYELKYKTAKFDLTMHAEEKGEELQFTWEYSTALFERETVERWAGHWLRLLKQVTENPDVRLGDIDLLTETEKDQLFKTFNSTKADYPENKTIQQLFEEQAERTPDHIAIAFKDRTLTYRELNKRANRLAHALRRRGVQPNDVIGLMMERSPDMIIGILGILKSGAAFVPVDPDYPAQRIRLMIEDSSASIFVAQSHLAERLPSAVTMIEADSSAMRNESEDNPAAVNEPEHFFYVIYTSGTTGKPKGVMLNHRNFVNLIHFQLTKTDVDFSHAVLQYATFNFDASYHEIFSTLLSGGRLQLITKEQRTDVNELLKIIEENRIQVLFLPPSFLKFVFQNKDYAERFPACVRHIACAGEQLVVTAEMKKALCEKQITLHNYYGPSETHVVTTLTMKPGDLIDDFPAIGKPISNTRIYLLNDSKKPVPIGVDGELYIAGDSVGPGYMNQAQLTAEKFEADPFHSGGRMYQTGDLARWLPDGNIKYIGRIDHQIKIRGYRIELDEIEQRLLAHEAVKEAAVIVRADAAGDKTLCAYYTAKLPVGTDELRGHLASALPAYMLPSFLTELERMPVTANGKLNRKALPEPKHLAGATYVEPSTATEAQLAVLWQETLGLDRVGADDHFFERGGHSLKAMNLVARIHQELDTEVPLRELFRHPTVRELAAWIEANGSASPYAAIQPAPRNIKRKGD